jgi:hypothetical protein
MNGFQKRVLYLVILVIIICFGLYSRKLTGGITEIIDIKDVVWATMVYFLFRIIFIDWPLKSVAVAGILFSFLIEASQIYHEVWIDRLRETFFGQMILGTGFVWSDLIAYSSGILLGVLTDFALRKYLIKRIG